MKKHGMMLAMALVSGVLVGCDSKEAEKVKSSATDATKAVGDTAKKAGEAVKDTAVKAADATKEAVKDAGAKAGEVAKAAGDKVADTAKAATDAGKGMVDKAKAAMIPDEAKKAFDGYVVEIGKTNSLLEKITNVDTAKASLLDLGKSVASLNGASALLDKLPADIKSSLMSGEGKGALDKAVSAFKGHIDRLTKDKGIDTLLGSTLKQFKLVG
jgi:hypothetical protein